MTDTLSCERPLREISSTRPLAQVEHICSVCGTPIAKGARYSRHVVYDPDTLIGRCSLRVFKWHLPMCPKGEG